MKYLILILFCPLLSKAQFKSYANFSMGICNGRIMNDIGFDQVELKEVRINSPIAQFGVNFTSEKLMIGFDISPTSNRFFSYFGGYAGPRFKNTYLYTGLSYYHFDNSRKGWSPRLGIQQDFFINLLPCYVRGELYTNSKNITVGINLPLNK